MPFTEDDLSHEIFVFAPSEDYRQFTCMVPTRHLCKKLVECCHIKDDEERRRCFRTFLHVPNLAATAGYLMEPLVHNLLPSGGSWPLLTLKSQPKKTMQHWVVDDAAEDQWLVIGFENQPAMHISSTNPSPDSPRGPLLKIKRYDTLTPSDLTDHCIYIPNSSVQPTFDSFYFRAGHVYMFQYTVTKDTHTVSKNGLELMQQLGVQKVIYIGVVPTGRQPRFLIEKTTAKYYEGLIAGRFLLELDPDVL
ncbi:hypothetical protein AZE42_13589 [Rhizopogon vesiculosus]|uniref:Uncharacterized protein n=1 Tax=Rhizopogon vesiculosus TaxID=180088 RepID=A0A1J8QL93_9AGAM|nr:hypothetical protein AZE42_13589 [Rhizopogon vesiculosus]